MILTLDSDDGRVVSTKLEHVEADKDGQAVLKDTQWPIYLALERLGDLVTVGSVAVPKLPGLSTAISELARALRARPEVPPKDFEEWWEAEKKRRGWLPDETVGSECAKGLRAQVKAMAVAACELGRRGGGPAETCVARAGQRKHGPCGKPTDTTRKVQGAPGLWVHVPLCSEHQSAWDEAGEWGGAWIHREKPLPTAEERNEGCEWDPETDRAAEGGDEHNRTAKATWTLGRGDRNIHVCEDCAKLPRFSRLRHRVRVAQAPGSARV